MPTQEELWFHVFFFVTFKNLIEPACGTLYCTIYVMVLSVNFESINSEKEPVAAAEHSTD